jgi:hypothetical protein
MLALAVGPSNCGKTYLVREWLLAMLLWRPREVLDMCPERFGRVLIMDPPTRKHPHGQYQGHRYHDVSDWRRSSTKARVCCFDNATAEALARLSLELQDTILVVDELERELDPSRPFSQDMKAIVHTGRHHGVMLVGTMRRLMGIRKEARSNIQLAYFGGLREADDRTYAARTTGVSVRELENLPPRVFLEWAPEMNTRRLIKIQNRARIVVRNKLTVS